MLKKAIKKSKEVLVKMNGFEIENLVLRMFGATPTEKNTSGVDGLMTVKGKTVRLEVKNHGLNRSSLGKIDLALSMEENVKSLLKSDLYANVRPQEQTVILMNKKEMFNWLMDERIVLDKDRHGNYKFKINFYPRSKKQDLKLKNVGLL